jgi:hypothetical protein
MDILGETMENRPLNKEGYTVLKFKDSGIDLLIPGYVIIKDEDIVSDIKEMYGLKPKIEELGILETNNSFNSITFFYPEKGQSMDFNDLEGLIDGIHRCLGDNQGIIEVNNGKTVRGYDFIYSIVKSVDKNGVQYFLRINIKKDDNILEIYGNFEESGMTGIRESIAASIADKAGICELGSDKWSQDPYDPEYKRGKCKNLAEKEGLDALFPESPLSQARKFLLAILKDEIVMENKDKMDEKVPLEKFFVDECRRNKYTVDIEKLMNDGM